MALRISPSFWRNQLRQWHWISSALCLTGMILFAVTGFTLNHAATIEAKPQVTAWEKTLSPDTLGRLQAMEVSSEKTVLSRDISQALRGETGVNLKRATAEISDEEIYLALPGPGVDEWMAIDRATGDVTYERSHRGVIAVLNDLHKGRNSGPVWSVFIDLIAVASVIFCLTGLGLLWIHARGRRITWPLAGLGAIVPLILFLLFIHA